MKPYTLLGPLTDGKAQRKAGDIVYRDDGGARWLWNQGLIAIDGVTKPRPAALLAPKPKPQGCRPCGY